MHSLRRCPWLLPYALQHRHHRAYKWARKYSYYSLTLRPGCVVAARRLFSANATPFRRDDDYDSEEEYSGDEDVVYGRLRSRVSISMFSSADAVDPFGEPMSMGWLLALMEDEAEAPRRECWVSKEEADAVKLKVAMPGLGKEHVKVWAHEDDLVIEGEGDKDTEYDDEEEAPAWYSHRIEFPADAFKMDQIKAEMKDGVLKVTVPKIKLEDRKDVPGQGGVEDGNQGWNQSVQVT